MKEIQFFVTFFRDNVRTTTKFCLCYFLSTLALDLSNKQSWWMVVSTMGIHDVDLDTSTIVFALLIFVKMSY